MGEAMSEPLSEEEMLRRFKEEESPIQETRDLADRIWREISPQLQPYKKRRRVWEWHVWWKPGLAIAMTALLAVAFWAGRVWESRHKADQSLAQSEAAERILLTATAEHLERSERFLVELKISGGGNAALAEQAKELLADNRLYQQSAAFAHDRPMTDTLDRLGRVLAEVADDQQGDFSEVEWRLDDLVQAIRTEQRRSPVKT